MGREISLSPPMPRHPTPPHSPSRPRRVFALTLANALFWAVDCYLSWNHVIPERFIPADAFVGLAFSIPLGCCSFPFLVMAQFHDTGWRIAVYGLLTLANSLAWAYLVDWLWTKFRTRRTPHGFPILDPAAKDPSAGNEQRRENGS